MLPVQHKDHKIYSSFTVHYVWQTAFRLKAASVLDHETRVWWIDGVQASAAVTRQQCKIAISRAVVYTSHNVQLCGRKCNSRPCVPQFRQEPPDMFSEDHGLVFRSFVYLFQTINEQKDKDFLLKASYLEIYNEKVSCHAFFVMPLRWWIEMCVCVGGGDSGHFSENFLNFKYFLNQVLVIKKVQTLNWKVARCSTLCP